MRGMQNFLKFAGLALSIIWMASAGTARAEDTLAVIKQKGVVTVGTEAAFPPFEFVQDGKIVGYGKDTLDSIVKDLGVKLNQFDVPFDGLYPGLLSGKWDFIATTLLEWEKPATKFAMTYPIAEGSTAVLTRKDDNRIKSAQDFDGHVIATQVGTGSAIRLEAMNAELEKDGKPGFDLKLFNSSPEFVVALANKQVDAAVGLLPDILEVVAKKQPDLFKLAGLLENKREYLGWATRPDDKGLRDYLSAQIKALRDSGKLYSGRRNGSAFEWSFRIQDTCRRARSQRTLPWATGAARSDVPVLEDGGRWHRTPLHIDLTYTCGSDAPTPSGRASDARSRARLDARQPRARTYAYAT